jgi:hypothetical protein
MSALLIVIALLLALIAVPFTAPVAAGPTIMGAACLFAILARIDQARTQHMQQRAQQTGRQEHASTASGVPSV